MSNYIFKKGDKVSFGGLEGVVIQNDMLLKLPVSVQFGEHTIEYFTKDGRYFLSHPEPLLKLIDPAEKPNVMMYPALVKEYSGYRISGFLFESEIDAQKIYRHEFIRLLKDRGVEV